MEVNLNRPAPNIYQKTVDKIRDHARDVLGTTKPGRKFIDKQVWWWNENVQEAILEKKSFKQWLATKTAVDYKSYKALKSAAKATVAQAKMAHYLDLYDKLDTQKGAKKIYRPAATRQSHPGHRADEEDPSQRRSTTPRPQGNSEQVRCEYL